MPGSHCKLFAVSGFKTDFCLLGFPVFERLPGWAHIWCVQLREVDLQQLWLWSEQVHAPGLLWCLATLDHQSAEQDAGEESEELDRETEAAELVEATGIQSCDWSLRLQVWFWTTEKGSQLDSTTTIQQLRYERMQDCFSGYDSTFARPQQWEWEWEAEEKTEEEQQEQQATAHHWTLNISWSADCEEEWEPGNTKQSSEN